MNSRPRGTTEFYREMLSILCENIHPLPTLAVISRNTVQCTWNSGVLAEPRFLCWTAAVHLLFSGCGSYSDMKRQAIPLTNIDSCFPLPIQCKYTWMPLSAIYLDGLSLLSVRGVLIVSHVCSRYSHRRMTGLNPWHFRQEPRALIAALARSEENIAEMNELIYINKIAHVSVCLYVCLSVTPQKTF